MSSETDFKIYGQLYKIGKDRQVTEKFKVRQFALKTLGRYPQTIKFQLSQDRCDLIDPYSPGDMVTIYFNIDGRENNEGKIFNNLTAWRIDGELSKESSIPDPAPQSRTAQPTAVDDDDLPF